MGDEAEVVQCPFNKSSTKYVMPSAAPIAMQSKRLDYLRDSCVVNCSQLAKMKKEIPYVPLP